MMLHCPCRHGESHNSHLHTLIPTKCLPRPTLWRPVAGASTLHEVTYMSHLTPHSPGTTGLIHGKWPHIARYGPLGPLLAPHGPYPKRGPCHAPYGPWGPHLAPQDPYPKKAPTMHHMTHGDPNLHHSTYSLNMAPAMHHMAHGPYGAW